MVHGFRVLGFEVPTDSIPYLQGFRFWFLCLGFQDLRSQLVLSLTQLTPYKSATDLIRYTTGHILYTADLRVRPLESARLP